MKMHNAEVEVARRGRDVDVDELDRILEQLLPYHASLGTSPRGWLSALVSLPAESVTQATLLAAAVVTQAAGADVVAVDAMTSEEFDARQGFVAIPELIGATEAAEILGVSRQAVQQMASAGRLPSQMVGKSLVMPRAAVVALAEARKTSVEIVDAASDCREGGAHDWDPVPLKMHRIAPDRSLVPAGDGDAEWHQCRRCGCFADTSKLTSGRVSAASQSGTDTVTAPETDERSGAMARGDIETFHEDGRWKNKVEGSSRAANTFDTKSEAQAKGRDMARSRKVEHVIRNKDGKIGEKNSYGNDPSSIPG